MIAFSNTKQNSQMPVLASAFGLLQFGSKQSERLSAPIGERLAVPGKLSLLVLMGHAKECQR